MIFSCARLRNFHICLIRIQNKSLVISQFPTMISQVKNKHMTISFHFDMINQGLIETHFSPTNTPIEPTIT